MGVFLILHDVEPTSLESHDMKEGVTVIMNCFNSEALIPEALRYLAAQKNTQDIPWEIILIDDNSRDRTSEVAQELWNEIGIAPLRLFREEGIGKMAALFKYFREAHYEYISIVDDDNWVEKEWIRKVYDFFRSNNDYGILGPASEGIFEGEKPAWFDRFNTAYAVGKQAQSSGDITNQREVWGAGASYRRQPILDLLDMGWRPIIPGPTGRKIIAGEDIEMCMAVKFLGWKVYFEENLMFQHYMPASRISWQNLRRMKVATGRARLVMDSYKLVEAGRYDNYGRPAVNWSSQVLKVLKELLGKPKWVAKSLWERQEGDWYLLYLEEHLHYLFELLTNRKKYYSTVYYLAQLFDHTLEN